MLEHCSLRSARNHQRKWQTLLPIIMGVKPLDVMTYTSKSTRQIYIYISNALQTAGLYPNALEALTAKSSQQPAFRVLPKHDKAKVPFPSNH